MDEILKMKATHEIETWCKKKLEASEGIKKIGIDMVIITRVEVILAALYLTN